MRNHPDWKQFLIEYRDCMIYQVFTVAFVSSVSLINTPRHILS